MAKTKVTAVILICLMALGAVYILPVKAQVSGSVTPSTSPTKQAGNVQTSTGNINGSTTLESNYTQIIIYPNGTLSGTNLIQQKGNTYTLTGNINGSITIDADNITLNGAGFTVQAVLIVTDPFGSPLNYHASNVTAIALIGVSGDTVKNLYVNDTGIPITLFNSSNCIILGNKLYSDYGYPGVIYLNNSVDNWINQNDIENGGAIGVGLWDYSNSNIISENIFNDNGSGFGTDISVVGSNNVISGNTVLAGGGISIGAEWLSMSGNTIIDNNLTSGGVELDSCSNTLVSKNNFYNCGIWFENDENGAISENNFIVDSAFKTNVTHPTANELLYYEPGLKDDLFYLNNFINITQIFAVDYGPYGQISGEQGFSQEDRFDNGTVGNYWSNYLSIYPLTENDSTGTYLTPYSSIVPFQYGYQFHDNHPLDKPVVFSQNDTDTPSWVTPAPTVAPANQLTPISYVVIVGIIAVVILAIGIITLLLHRRRTRYQVARMACS